MRRHAMVVVLLLLVPSLLVAAELILKTPGGNESWPLNSQQVIKWEAPGVTSTVLLVLKKDGTAVGNIATGLGAQSGSYPWTVGQYLGGTAASGSGYSIRIKTTDATSYHDENDVPFTITGASYSAAIKRKATFLQAAQFLAKPDLIVDSVVVTPASICGGWTNFSITFKNIGQGNAGGFQYRMYIYYWGQQGTTNPGSDWNLYWDGNVGAIAKGATSTITRQHNFGFGGKWVVVVDIDQVYKAVSETDETNNKGQAEFWTPPC